MAFYYYCYYYFLLYTDCQKKNETLQIFNVFHIGSVGVYIGLFKKQIETNHRMDR